MYFKSHVLILFNEYSNQNWVADKGALFHIKYLKMKSYKVIEIDYVHPSRTIETILIGIKKNGTIVYIYNFEGLFFRVFNSFIEILEFFTDKKEPKIYFESEDDLDEYLGNLDVDFS